MDSAYKELQSFKYDSLQEVYKKTLESFQEMTASHQKAFLQKFLSSQEPGHADAYILCALAKSFPIQLRSGDLVIASSEITLSGNTDGTGWSDRVMKLRDILINHVV